MLLSRRAAAGAALNDQRNLAAFTLSLLRAAPRLGAAHQAIEENKATADQPPLLKLFYKESDFNGRLRVSNWIVHRLNYYAVKKTVELRF